MYFDGNINMPLMTVADAIVSSLVANKCQHVFGIPGVQIYELMDAFYKRSDQITFISTRHEQCAAYMANGYSHITNDFGVAVVVPGPGLMNASAGIGTAYASTNSVLIISGQIAKHLIGYSTGALHEVDNHETLVQQVTKWSQVFDSPDNLQLDIKNTFDHLKSGITLPVEIEIPEDVLGQKVDFDIPPKTEKSFPKIDSNTLHTVIEKISQSERPLLWVGAGNNKGKQLIHTLAELIQSPVITTGNGKGMMDNDHDLYIGYPVNKCKDIDDLIKESDLIISIGTRLPEYKLHLMEDVIDIVSSKPNHYRQSNINNTSISGNPNNTLELIINSINKPKTNSFSKLEIQQVKKSRDLVLNSMEPQISFVKAISSVAPKDTILVEGVNQIGYVCRWAFPVHTHNGYITSSYFGNLGYAYPTALGAKVADPDRPVICISGDGGFLYNSQEMNTAVNYGINVIAVVFNDQAYGNVHRDQIQKYDNRVIGSKLKNPDFVKLANSYGMHAVKVSTPEELKLELQKAINSRGPYLIEVTVGMMPSPW